MLRQHLTKITEQSPVNEHPDLIKQLRASIEHTIVVLESGTAIDQYTCAVYAFHLVGDPTYLSIASYGLGRTFAGKEFIAFLLSNNFLALRGSEEISQGDLVTYFENEDFRHVGRIANSERVVSKWGAGWLYEHGLWEVPVGYGHEVRYYAGPNKERSFDLFLKYAESKGFTFE